MKLSFKRKLFGWIESFDNWTFLNERDFVLHRARKAFSLSYVTANDGMVTNLTWQSDLKKKKKKLWSDEGWHVRDKSFNISWWTSWERYYLVENLRPKINREILEERIAHKFTANKNAVKSDRIQKFKQNPMTWGSVRIFRTNTLRIFKFQKSTYNMYKISKALSKILQQIIIIIMNII